VANVDIRYVQAGDVEELVAKMRQADVAELSALAITDFVERIHLSVKISTICRTAVIDGELACIFGVTPLSLTAGVPWMLGTDVVTKNQRALMSLCRPYIQDMLLAYPHLLNYVHAENQAAKRWLKRMGFVLQPAAPYGDLGAPFHRFDMRANHV
jgi:hypothetical protein